MDGRGHLTFAPVFTCLSAAALASSSMIPVTSGDMTLTVAVAIATSFVTAKLPDADQLALKPRPIIMGTAKKRFSKRYNKEYYYVVVSEKEFIDKYGKSELAEQAKGKGSVSCERTKTGKFLVYYDKAGTKNKLMLMFALLFQAMGLKKHRGWQSHSPLLWGLASFALVGTVYAIPEMGVYLGNIVLGLCLGYMSHIVGDMLTMDGTEVLPNFFGVFGKFLPKKMRRKVNKSAVGKGLNAVSGARFRPMKHFGFAKSGSMVWTYCLCFIFINIFAYVFLPVFFASFWSFSLDVLGRLWECILWLMIKLKDIFIGLMG